MRGARAAAAVLRSVIGAYSSAAAPRLTTVHHSISAADADGSSGWIADLRYVALHYNAGFQRSRREAMDALGTSLIALAVIVGGAFGGIWLRNVLPERHLADRDKGRRAAGNRSDWNDLSVSPRPAHRLG